MSPESDLPHLMAMQCPNAILARDINICLGFFVGALQNSTKIREFSLKFQLISILPKHRHVSGKLNCCFKIWLPIPKY